MLLYIAAYGRNVEIPTEMAGFLLECGICKLSHAGCLNIMMHLESGYFYSPAARLDLYKNIGREFGAAI